MSRLVSIIVGAAIVVGLGAGAGLVQSVMAQSDPIVERKALMRAQGSATGRAVAMLRAQTPYDEAQAKAVLNAYIETTAKFQALFPETSRTGDTRAAAKIWEDKAGFAAANDKFAADSKAALSKTASLETFRPAFEAATQNCNSCHEVYRTAR